MVMVSFFLIRAAFIRVLHV